MAPWWVGDRALSAGCRVRFGVALPPGIPGHQGTRGPGWPFVRPRKAGRSMNALITSTGVPPADAPLRTQRSLAGGHLVIRVTSPRIWAVPDVQRGRQGLWAPSPR